MKAGSRAGRENKYQFNAGSELNEETQNYEMFFRAYDPAIGRMMGVDPYAEKFRGLSPYNYANNDPMYYNDPSGGIAMALTEEDLWVENIYNESANNGSASGSGGGGFGTRQNSFANGTHWSQGYSSVSANLMSMSTSAWQNAYQTNQMTDAEKADFAVNNGLGASNGEGVLGENFTLDGSGNMMHYQVHVVSSVETDENGNVINANNFDGITSVTPQIIGSFGDNSRNVYAGVWGQTQNSNIDWGEVFDGSMALGGGLVSTVGGIAAIASGVAAPVGVVGVATGVPAMGFGLAKIINGFQGNEMDIPSGMGEAIDQGIGGSGANGQVLDVISGGFPKNLHSTIFVGYDIYDSDYFQQVISPSNPAPSKTK